MQLITRCWYGYKNQDKLELNMSIKRHVHLCFSDNFSTCIALSQTFAWIEIISVYKLKLELNGIFIQALVCIYTQ